MCWRRVYYLSTLQMIHWRARVLLLILLVVWVLDLLSRWSR